MTRHIAPVAFTPNARGNRHGAMVVPNQRPAANGAHGVSVIRRDWDALVILVRKIWVNRLRFVTHWAFTTAILIFKAFHSATQRLTTSSGSAAAPRSA